MLVITEYKVNDACSNTHNGITAKITELLQAGRQARHGDSCVPHAGSLLIHKTVTLICTALITTAYAFCLLQLGNLA